MFIKYARFKNGVSNNSLFDFLWNRVLYHQRNTASEATFASNTRNVNSLQMEDLFTGVRLYNCRFRSVDVGSVRYIFQTRRATRLQFYVQVTNLCKLFWPKFTTIGQQMGALFTKWSVVNVSSVVKAWVRYTISSTPEDLQCWNISYGWRKINVNILPKVQRNQSTNRRVIHKWSVVLSFKTPPPISTNNQKL